MIVAVQGSNNFKDYNVFLRSMAVAMSNLQEEDKYFYIYTAGPANINSMVMEFVNLSERGMKSRGKKIKFFKVPPSWISENMSNVGYFAYLSTANEHNSKLVGEAELNDIEVGIFRY